MDKRETCVRNLDVLWDRFLTARAAFPYYRPSDIGRSEKRSALFYRKRNKDLRLTFPTSIDEQDVRHLNDVGYWINLSLIIGAFAILESHGFLKKIDHERVGAGDVERLRRLRRVFAHTNGRYNPEDKDERRLFEAIVRRYQPRRVDPIRFNLQIDEVLTPMMRGIKEYVLASS